MRGWTFEGSTFIFPRGKDGPSFPRCFSIDFRGKSDWSRPAGLEVVFFDDSIFVAVVDGLEGWVVGSVAQADDASATTIASTAMSGAMANLGVGLVTAQTERLIIVFIFNWS